MEIEAEQITYYAGKMIDEACRTVTNEYRRQFSLIILTRFDITFVRFIFPKKEESKIQALGNGISLNPLPHLTGSS